MGNLTKYTELVAIIFIVFFLLFSRNLCTNISTNETTFNELCRFEGMCLNCSEGGCDDMCQFYDNKCCLSTSPKNTVLEEWQFSCVRRFPDMHDLHLDCRGSFKGVYGVYMVTKCSKEWIDKSIKAKCENRSDTDFLSRIPVYDFMYEKVTYENMYCAFCNWLNLERLRFWRFDLLCDGARANFSKSETYFVPEDCFIRLVYRQHKMCAFDVIESCEKSEHINKSLKDKCENGLSQNVYVWKYGNVFNIYKNEFCARCNHETRTLQCWAFQAFTCWPQDLPPYRSVEAMVNLNLYGDSNRHTQQILNSICGENVLFDPLSKTCLNVTCLPIQNTCISGKCHLVELAASEFTIQNDSSLYFYALDAIIQEVRYFFKDSTAHVCLNDNQFIDFDKVQTTAQATTEKSFSTVTVNMSPSLFCFHLYFILFSFHVIFSSMCQFVFV